MENLYQILAIIAAFTFIYSIFAGRLESTSISDAMVYVVFGFLSGQNGLNILPLDIESEGVRLLAELTLALVLFSDASGADLKILKSSLSLPSRLLLIGLPITIIFGVGVGKLLFPNVSWLEVGILATMLAPTDAALGKAVVSNPKVPAQIRQVLNVESGLNDGICVPILFVLLAIVIPGNMEGSISDLVVHLFVEEIGIGALVGASIAVLGAQLGSFAVRKNWVTKTWRQISLPAIAFTCFATAQSLGGSGFIASFVGGLFFGSIIKVYKDEMIEVSEGIGNAMSLITWVIFGVTVVGKYMGQLTLPIILYSILSLTIVRILPVFLCLFGVTLDLESKLFMGWFGPRGLASIVFAVIVLNSNLPSGDILTTTVTCTVLLSIIAHGLTANPWANRYG
ncbi:MULTISPECIES: cation:proton antiporter [Crocosphaera]|uniref:Na+/H+ antiporter n=4 Tax=Crocosphaera watsonii TaxID=263511 RepID=T2JS96_CROWT|nr:MULTISPECIES: cation:proton antiporter [Crocosphaera]EHJ11933.1 putative Na+/H+ antiporter [Crocosphaera watsonii WH 0003]MCH2243384.1 cation:proton antiporter [Crocosphaera sp.]NQZ63753.1 cation:proton antiporter [Crocosphaera sp.]CCQ49715.1 Na+/H+ antiporter [Crocosphaera watsonii WH 8502]CCQ54462.1 Na+/H+ antiporter [Crocosphaera watsonii WH 0005]